MATNCSFINATEARNTARNNTTIWEEICEVQTQILGAIDGNLYSVLVNDDTPFTETQAILDTIVITDAGAGYDPVTAAVVINANGLTGIGAVVTVSPTGTTILDGDFTIVNGGGLVMQSAAPVLLGSGYAIDELLTLDGTNATATTDAIVQVDTLSTLATADSETNYDGAGDNGTFIAGTGYTALDVITLDDGTKVRVDTAPGGNITEFTITSTTTIGSDGNLATLFQLGTTVPAGVGAGFSLTQGLANQGVFSVTVNDVGLYTVVGNNPDTTTSAGAGSGCTISFVITAGYAPVSVTASVKVPNDLIDGQDETNFDNVPQNGDFNAGDSYRVDEVITLVDASVVTVSAGGISATGVVSIAAQTHADFDGVGANGSFVGGDGAGGTAYVVDNIITLSDGSTITVDAIAGNGDVTQFTITTASTVKYTSGANLFQQGQVNGAGNGLGFTITSDTNNEITVGSVTLFDTASAGSTPYYQTTLLQLSTDGIGSRFSLTPAGNNQISVVQGTGVSLVVTETSGVITNVTAAGGSGYVIGATLIFIHPNGINAAASVTSISATGGVITGITVSNGGSGYEQAIATITVTAPGGQTPALAFAGTVVTINGSVTGISIQEGGLGYADLLPTATIDTIGQAGTGATLLVNLTDPLDGTIDTIKVVTGGSGYVSPSVVILPAITDIGPPIIFDSVSTEATATATAGTNTFGTVPTDYYSAWAGLTTDVVISDQLQYVLDYFTALGYNIRIQTNSTTTNTIQWQIIW